MRKIGAGLDQVRKLLAETDRHRYASRMARRGAASAPSMLLPASEQRDLRRRGELGGGCRDEIGALLVREPPDEADERVIARIEVEPLLQRALVDVLFSSVEAS